MVFKAFDEDAKTLLRRFQQDSAYCGSDYSYHAFLSWFDDLEYAADEDAFFMRAPMDGKIYYWAPLTRPGFSRAEAVSRLDADACFAFCTEDFINEVYGKYRIYSHRDWTEYIYRAKDFIGLEGKRYHAKRNHIAKFRSKYASEMSPLRREDFSEIAAFEKKWLDSRDFDEKMEESALRESKIVSGWLAAALEGELCSDVLRVDGEVAGIAIGEILPSGNAVVMYEKADIGYEGIYSYLAREFAARRFSECEYINRQEDMGLEGLRKSKLSYYPAFLLDKYVLCPYEKELNCDAEEPKLRIGNRIVEEKSLPPEKYRFSRLSINDYDAVAAFYREGIAGLKNKLFFLNYTEDELRGVLETGYMYAAFDGNEIVSVCAADTDKEYGAELAGICGDSSGRQYYEFSGIMTAAAHRGKGLSRRVCSAVIDYAKLELAPCTLCAVVQFDNAPSLENLGRMGFKAVTTKSRPPYTFTYLTLDIS